MTHPCAAISWILSRRQFRKNRKVYIMQTLVMALSVFIVNGCFYGIHGMLDSTLEPLRRWTGGNTVILHSSEKPGFEYTTRGVIARWSWGLFTPTDIAAVPQVSCLVLNLPAMTSFDGDNQWRVYGRTTFYSNTVSETTFNQMEPDQVIVNTLRPDIRDKLAPGTRVRIFVPLVVPGKGAPNYIGVPRPVEGIDYIDFGHGRWVDVTVVAVTNEVFYNDAIVCKLDWLQAISGGHDFVNWAAVGLNSGHPSLTELAETGEWQVFPSSDVLYGVSAELSAIEESGRYLWLSILAIAAVMSLTTASYVVVRDERDITLMQVLGVGRAQAASLLALPVTLSAFAGSLLGMALVRLVLAAILHRVSFSTSDFVTFILAPAAFVGLAAYGQGMLRIEEFPDLEGLSNYE